MKQEKVICEVMEKIAMIAEQYPELRTSKNYGKYVAAIESYEKMLHTSTLLFFLIKFLELFEIMV